MEVALVSLQECLLVDGPTTTGQSMPHDPAVLDKPVWPLLKSGIEVEPERGSSALSVIPVARFDGVMVQGRRGRGEHPVALHVDVVSGLYSATFGK